MTRAEPSVPGPTDAICSFQNSWVLFWPVPVFDEGDPPCLHPGLTWPQRIVRQIRGGPRGDQGCCWLHGGDWRRVCRIAADLTRDTPSPGQNDVPSTRIIQAAAAAGLTTWEHQALASLFRAPINLRRAESGQRHYNDGRHRSHALLTAGVRRCPTVHWTWPHH